MQYTIRAAMARLSKLILAALAAEEVIIANDGKPLVKLVPATHSGYKLGGLEGKVAPPPDEFFGPPGEAELAERE